MDGISAARPLLSIQATRSKCQKILGSLLHLLGQPDLEFQWHILVSDFTNVDKGMRCGDVGKYFSLADITLITSLAISRTYHIDSHCQNYTKSDQYTVKLVYWVAQNNLEREAYAFYLNPVLPSSKHLFGKFIHYRKYLILYSS